MVMAFDWINSFGVICWFHPLDIDSNDSDADHNTSITTITTTTAIAIAIITANTIITIIVTITKSKCPFRLGYHTSEQTRNYPVAHDAKTSAKVMECQVLETVVLARVKSGSMEKIMYLWNDFLGIQPGRDLGVRLDRYIGPKQQAGMERLLGNTVRSRPKCSVGPL